MGLNEWPKKIKFRRVSQYDSLGITIPNDLHGLLGWGDGDKLTVHFDLDEKTICLKKSEDERNTR